jgi:cytochrome c oxidase subunit 3
MGGIAAFVMLFGAVMWMAKGMPWMFFAGLVGVLYVMWAWWRETILENKAGDHTPVVRIGLRYGFIMFIMSEVMFFAAFFGALYYARVFSVPWLGGGDPGTNEVLWSGFEAA